jgi:integrase
MSVYKPDRSPYFLFDFWFRGHRVHGSTKCTSRREAEKVETAAREKAKQTVAQTIAARTSLRLDDIAGRFWQEKGQHHSGCENTEHRLSLIIEFLGKDVLLTDIGDDHVARLKAWRRGHRVRATVPNGTGRAPVANGTGRATVPNGTVRATAANAAVQLISPATVNHTLATLRELFTYSKLVLRVRFEHEPHWRQHWLKTPTERVRELHDEEADQLDAAMHDDWRPFFAFVRASGLRLNECLLRWSEVDWTARQIVKIGKGGRRVVTPITSEIRDILWPLRGDHPEMVFTFVPQQARIRDTVATSRPSRPATCSLKPNDLVPGAPIRKPLTYAGVQTYWRRLRLRAGVTGFRFHDFRHDLATKALRETGNLKLVSRMLNHRDLRSTLRYAHVLDSEVADAMERVAQQRKRPPRLKVV